MRFTALINIFFTKSFNNTKVHVHVYVTGFLSNKNVYMYGVIIILLWYSTSNMGYRLCTMLK